MSMITLALSKGRIFDETLPLLQAAGIEVLEDPEKSRKLILPTNRDDVRVVLVRATDVPTYVQHGGADLGVAGKDTLYEHGGQGLFFLVAQAGSGLVQGDQLGFGGKGAGDIMGFQNAGENVVALCDVDDQRVELLGPRQHNHHFRGGQVN